jgi:hypothetical protein
MKLLLLRILSGCLFLSALSHLLFPGQTERIMSRERNVRFAGGILFAFAAAFAMARLYIIAAALLLFAFPRAFRPNGSIRLQQRLYSRRVHGAVLLAGALLVLLASRFA